MIRITFSDNEEVDVTPETKMLAAQGSYDENDNGNYTAQGVFAGRSGSPEIKTDEVLAGFEGLLSRADWISFGDTKKIYKTSAIVKIELVN